jgi:outer membrane protein assembly factor BamB
VKKILTALALGACLSGCGPKQLWQAEAGFPSKAAPVVGDSNAFIPVDGGLKALSLASGNQVWTWKPQDNSYGIYGVRALGHGRLAVLGGKRMAVLDQKDGSVLWEVSDSGAFLGRPDGDLLPFGGGPVLQLVDFANLAHAGSMVPDGNLELGDSAMQKETLYANFVSGTEGGTASYDIRAQKSNWQSMMSSPMLGPPLPWGERVVVVESFKSAGAAAAPAAESLDAAGGFLRWKHDFHAAAPRPAFVPPALLCGSAAVFAFSGAGKDGLIALGPDGKELWKLDFGWFIQDEGVTAPAFDGKLLCVGAGNRLLGVSPEGKLLWKRKMDVDSLLGVGLAHGVLLTLDRKGHVEAFDVAD